MYFRKSVFHLHSFWTNIVRFIADLTDLQVRFRTKFDLKNAHILQILSFQLKLVWGHPDFSTYYHYSIYFVLNTCNKRCIQYCSMSVHLVIHGCTAVHRTCTIPDTENQCGSCMAPDDHRQPPMVPQEVVRLSRHGTILGPWRAVGCHRWPSGAMHVRQQFSPSRLVLVHLLKLKKNNFTSENFVYFILVK